MAIALLFIESGNIRQRIVQQKFSVRTLSMTTSIRQIFTSEQRDLCYRLQADIFHHELHLFGMKIPDRYDRHSLYMQILDAETVIGTYRIVLPNTSLGLPIEESGFHLKQFHEGQVCEMSRLVLLKEKRGKVPFRKIVSSAREVAKQHHASVLVAALLPRNLPLFQRHGFSQAGPPLQDPSVDSTDPDNGIVIPVKTHVRPLERNG